VGAEQGTAAAVACGVGNGAGRLVRADVRAHASHLLKTDVGLSGCVHIVDEVDEGRLHPREHADLQIVVAPRGVPDFVGGERLGLRGAGVGVLGYHDVAGNLAAGAAGALLFKENAD
ncbi:hypothetical protein V2V61_11075, partial [Streptococcus agalactiae]